MAPPPTRPTAAEQNSDDLHCRRICKRPMRNAAAKVYGKTAHRPRGAKPKSNFPPPDLNVAVDSTPRVAGESLSPAASYPMLYLNPESYQEIADIINKMRGFGESSGGGGVSGGGSAAESSSPAKNSAESAKENGVDVELKLSTFENI